MAQSPNDDQELLRQLAKGNEKAFGTCYERYQGPIYRFAWHMSGNQANAEEVTQEVFLRLIDNPRKYDPARGSLAGYLFGIARNVMHRQFEASRLDQPLKDEMLDGDDATVAAEPDLLWELDRQERLEHLHKSVLALPELYREALVLCDLEEMSYPEAATILKCPPGTVASRLHRARAMLKLRLKKRMGCVR
jgi:RNA polymerase sigma-70 factor, ECF subfamily